MMDRVESAKADKRAFFDLCESLNLRIKEGNVRELCEEIRKLNLEDVWMTLENTPHQYCLLHNIVEFVPGTLSGRSASRPTWQFPLADLLQISYINLICVPLFRSDRMKTIFDRSDQPKVYFFKKEISPDSIWDDIEAFIKDQRVEERDYVVVHDDCGHVNWDELTEVLPCNLVVTKAHAEVSNVHNEPWDSAKLWKRFEDELFREGGEVNEVSDNLSFTFSLK